MSFVIFVIYILLLIVGFFLALYFPIRLISMMISAHYGAPFVPLSYEMIRHMFDLIELEKGQHVIDLGSGDGRILIAAASEYGAVGEGYEVAWYPLLLSRWSLWVQRLGDKVKIRRADFFKQDISQADVITAYQEPWLLDRLEHKCEAELGDGAVVISPRFEMKGWKQQIVDRECKYPIYIYKMKDVRESGKKDL